jgi:uroporphyrinogen III methyltransferase/synthase
VSDSAGKVFLVGAGPGDPSLVTLRAKELIASCDVLVFDYLLSDTLLTWTRSDCRKICVGKRPGFHSVEQEVIEELLVKEARRGHEVVRLKGGDPFVFGRGGEEMRCLRREGIEFEVVPAVTAALAAASRLRIPLTSRNLSSSVTFLTGHEDPEKGLPLTDWALHAQTGGTLCLYMSMKHLPFIVARLREAGMNPSTPAAAIQWATMPEEKQVRGTLESLPELVRAAGLSSPAIVIVGEVADDAGDSPERGTD